MGRGCQGRSSKREDLTAPLKGKRSYSGEMVGRYPWKRSQQVQRQEVSPERGARTGSALGEIRGTGKRGGGRRVSSATLGSVCFVLR